MPHIKYINKRISAERLAIIEQANRIINQYVAQGFTLTLRQLYYQFVARDLIPNNDRSYKNLGDIISDGRMVGLIDWRAITDRLRLVHARSSWDNPGDFIGDVAHHYHTDFWADQSKYVEVWVEKDALSDIVAVCDAKHSMCLTWCAVASHRRRRCGKQRCAWCVSTARASIHSYCTSLITTPAAST